MEFRTAKVGEIQRLMVQELEKIYPVEEAFSITNALFLHYLGLSKAWVIMEKDKLLSESQLLHFQRAMKRLMLHEPLQYITAKAYFSGLEFKVGPSVLIPRPETEELVDWVVATTNKDAELKILDIGSGSGCIAIALKKVLEKAEVHAIDISIDALNLAKENAELNKVDVRFNRFDILDISLWKSLGVFDAIISNPPYVTPSDKKKMRKNVTDYEPQRALFVEEEDPLIFYRTIIQFSNDHLAPLGRLFFECNESNAREVAKLMKAGGFNNVQLRKDMQGKERMVLGFMS